MQIAPPETEQDRGMGFAHARVHRQWVLEEKGVGTRQRNFASPAPKISLPRAHLLLSPTPPRSSGSDGDSDVDSELEERVDGVKSWLSKNKGSSKALSDDGSLKSSRWVQGRGAGVAGRGRAGRLPAVLGDVWGAGWAPMGRGTAGATLLLGACVAGQGRVNTGEWLGWRRDPPWRCRGIRSPHQSGSGWWAPALCIIPPHSGAGSPLHPPLLCGSTASLPALLGKRRLPTQPPAVLVEGGTCSGAPTAQGWRGAGAHGPAPTPRGRHSPAEHRLLLSKPNFLAGLWESRGAPPPLPSRGERSEPFFLNWFNLFSGADVKHFVIGDNSTFSEVGNQTRRLQVADNEIN